MNLDLAGDKSKSRRLPRRNHSKSGDSNEWRFTQKLYDQKEKAQKVNENSVFAVQEQSFPWLLCRIVAAVLVLWLIFAVFVGPQEKHRKRRKQHDEGDFVENIGSYWEGLLQSLLFFSWQEPVKRDTKSSGIPIRTFYDLSRKIPHPESGSVNGASKTADTATDL